MTAETEYAFTYQADLSLEDNNENTKELSSIADEPKKQTYFISKDKSKLYVLVYERESDSDESLPEDLQTFNDFKISNAPGAFKQLNAYIDEKARRYTSEEFEKDDNWKDGLEIFRKTLIGLETQYVVDGGVSFEDDETGQRVMKIKLDDRRSNFEFTDANQTNGDVSFDATTGTIIIKNIQFFSETELKLDTLQEDIQKYIVSYDEQTNDGRYTLDEFQSKMGEDKLRELIATALGVAKEVTPPEPEPEQPENPDSGDTNGTNPLADTTTPPGTIIDHSKIKNLYLRGDDLVIDLECDEKQKYTVPGGYDTDKYLFDQANDRLIVKGLKYFTEYDITNTIQAFSNLDQKIINIDNQYTVEQFKSFVEGESTSKEYKQLIANALKANGKTFDADLITKLTVTPHDTSPTKATLKIEFDSDFKKYKSTDPTQFPIAFNSKDSYMDIQLTFFKEVQMNNLQEQIQIFINEDTGQQYTVEEFEEKVNSPTTNEVKEIITQYVEASIDGASDVTKFIYTKDTNELAFDVTIRKYEKFPPNGPNIQYKLLNKKDDGSVTYKVTITDLKYWFDFEIKEEDLKKTKEKVNEIIDLFAVCVSTDEEDNNYEEYKEKIFNAFGETPVNDTLKLSQFMSFTDTDFKLEKSKDFVINLNGKLEGIGKPREFKAINMTSEGISLDPKTKILRFNDFMFSTPANYFIYHPTHKGWIIGLTEKGLEQETLKIPGGHDGVAITHIANNFEQFGGGNFQYSKARNVYFPDTIELMNSSKLFYLSPYLETVRMSKNCTTINGWHCFRGNPNLTNLHWPSGSKFNWLQDYNITENDSLEKLLLPRSLIEYRGAVFGTKNPKTSNGKYIISWLSDFTTKFRLGSFCDKQYNIEAIIMLADKLIYDANGDRKNIFPKDKTLYTKLKYYVKSEQVKNTLINDAKVPPEMVVYKSGLEKILIQQGHIPEDW